MEVEWSYGLIFYYFGDNKMKRNYNAVAITFPSFLKRLKCVFCPRKHYYYIPMKKKEEEELLPQLSRTKSTIFIIQNSEQKASRSPNGTA